MEGLEQKRRIPNTTLPSTSVELECVTPTARAGDSPTDCYAVGRFTSALVFSIFHVARSGGGSVYMHIRHASIIITRSLIKYEPSPHPDLFVGGTAFHSVEIQLEMTWLSTSKQMINRGPLFL